MALNVQTTPNTPSFIAAPIQVPANIATPQATMANVKAGQSELNAVNNFTGGGRSRGRGRSSRRSRGSRGFIRHTRRNASIIRTYKGRKYQEPPQKGGNGGAIVIPQVGSTCSSGPNCAGAQNAAFTAIHNQAASNGANDAYASQSGGGRHGRKVRFSKHQYTYRNRGRSHSRKPRHDQSLTTMIAYNIKKVMRKVLS